MIADRNGTEFTCLSQNRMFEISQNGAFTTHGIVNDKTRQADYVILTVAPEHFVLFGLSGCRMKP